MFFDACILYVDNFLLYNHLLFKNSRFIQLNPSETTHEILGNVRLEQTHFTLSANLLEEVKSKLEMDDESYVVAKDLIARGEISGRKSAIKARNVFQLNGKAQLKESQFIVDEAIIYSENSLLETSHTQISAKKIYTQKNAQTKFSEQSLLFADSFLTGENTKTLADKSSELHARKFIANGAIGLKDALLSTNELMIAHQFSVKNSVVHAKENIVIADEANAFLEKSNMTAKNIHHMGQLGMEDSHIKATEHLNLYQHSETEWSGKNVLQAQNMYAGGEMRGYKSQVEEDEKIDPQRDITMIKVENYLNIDLTGKITTDSKLDCEAAYTTQRGDILSTSEIYRHGQGIFQSGHVHANKAYYGFDYFMLNCGDIHAPELTIHSNTFNFGAIRSEASFNNSGFLSLNAGVISANNYINNNLVSLNAGLTLPNFSANPKYLFSPSNLLTAGITIATNLFPKYQCGIGFAASLVNLRDIYNASCKLPEQLDYENLSKLKLHQIMPLIGQLRAVGAFASSMTNSVAGSWNESATWSESLKSFYNNPSVWMEEWNSLMANHDWDSTLRTTTGAFFGTHVDNSLMHINTGAKIAMNSRVVNGYHLNAGQEYSVLSHSVNTQILDNRGTTSSAKMNYKANKINNSGTINAKNGLNINGGEINNSKEGKINGTKASINVDKINQDGELNLENANIHAKEFSDTASAHTSVVNGNITIEHFDEKGSVDLQNVNAKIDDFTTEKDSHLHTDNVVIHSNTIDINGHVKYEYYLGINTHHGHIGQDGHVVGETSKEEDLFKEKQEPQQEEQKTEDTKNTMNAKAANPFLAKAANPLYKHVNPITDDPDEDHIHRHDNNHDNHPNIHRHDDWHVHHPIIVDTEHSNIHKHNNEIHPIHVKVDDGHVEVIHHEGHVESNGNIHVNADGTIDVDGDLYIDGDVEINPIHVHVDYVEIIPIHENIIEDGQVEVIHHEGRIESDGNIHVNADGMIEVDGDLKIDGDISLDEHHGLRNHGMPLMRASSTAQNDSSAKDNEPKKPELEFTPEHVFVLNADDMKIDGEISGGDYTQIHGLPNEKGETTACESLEIGEGAHVKSKHGDIQANHVKTNGRVDLTKFNLKLKDHRIGKNGSLSIDSTYYEGDNLDSSGSTIVNNSYLKVKDQHFDENAKQYNQKAMFEADKYVDEGQMEVSGLVSIVADEYRHLGQISESSSSTDKNTLYVKARHAVLEGKAKVSNEFFEVEHVDNANQLVEGQGQYSNYQASESFGVKTQEDLNINQSIQRDCDVYVESLSVNVSADSHHDQHNITLVSTQGDISITGNLTTKNMYVDSAGQIAHNSSLYAKEAIMMQAKKGIYECGGVMNGETVALKGSEVKNIKAGSELAAQGTPLPVGGQGVLNGRSEIYIEATEGDIVNVGGDINGGHYTQLIAHHDVINQCNTQTYQGQFDNQKNFIPAQISGGDGEKTEGVGLYVQAGNKVHSEASVWRSQGTNYINGKKGVDLHGKQHTYVSNKYDKKKWGGLKKVHVVETATNFRGTEVISDTNRNIIITEEGGIQSVGTHFIAPGGTDMVARDDIRLSSMKAENHRYEKSSSFFGTSQHEREEMHEVAYENVFADNGITRLQSLEGSIKSVGTTFIGKGDLELMAKIDVSLAAEILSHDVKEHHRGVNISGFGKHAYDEAKQGGKTWRALSSEDATLAKVNSLINSGNAAEVAANLSNLGIDVTNTSNSLARGIMNGEIGKELQARYALGGEGGFNPNVSVSLTDVNTHQTYQTQGPGSIHRDNVKVVAGENAEFLQGYKVQVDKDMDVDAKRMVNTAAELHSTQDQHSKTYTVNMNATGHIQSLGYAQSDSHSEKTTYANSTVEVGGNLKLHHGDGAMEQVRLEGANVHAQTLDARINHLEITDQQSTSKNESRSIGVSTSGDVSYYKGHGEECVTQKHSGIEVDQGINTGGHTVEVHETVMTGGYINTSGENHFKTDILETHELHDSRQYHGSGVSFNILEMNRQLHHEAHQEKVGEKVIGTVGTFKFDQVNYSANQMAVVHGDQGTYLDVGQMLGAVHTDSRNGTVVERDQQMHLKVDVPVVHQDSMDTVKHHYEGARNRLFPTPNQSKHQVKEHALPLRRPEKPVKEKAPVHGSGAKPKKINPEDVAKAVKYSLDHLKFSSKKKEEAFKKTLMQAQDEMQHRGKISKETESDLKRQLTEAVLKTMKAGFEEGLEIIKDKLGPEFNQSLIKLLSHPENFEHAIGRIYLGTKGALIEFTFNALLTSFDDKVDKGIAQLRHAFIETGVELSMGVLLSYVPGAGMVMTICEVLDHFYDKEAVDRMLNESTQHNAQGHEYIQQEQYGAAYVEFATAQRQQENAAYAQMMHGIASVSEHVIDDVEDWVKSSRFFKSQASNAEDSAKPNYQHR